MSKRRDSNPQGNTTSRPARENLPSKDRRPKPIRTKSALHLENTSSVPKSEPLATTKRRVAPAGRALSLSRIPHAKKTT